MVLQSILKHHGEQNLKNKHLKSFNVIALNTKKESQDLS